MPHTRHEQYLGSRVDDQPVQARMHQVDPGARTPMAEQPRLDVRGLQRLRQRDVVHEVDLGRRHEIRQPSVPSQRAQPVRRGSHTRENASDLVSLPICCVLSGLLGPQRVDLCRESSLLLSEQLSVDLIGVVEPQEPVPFLDEASECVWRG